MIESIPRDMRRLGLGGMARAFETQLEQPGTYDELDFAERLRALIDHELTHRDQRRLERLRRNAKLKLTATLGQIDYRHPRGLKKSQIAALQNGDWLQRRHNVLVHGPTGAGKTFFACAFGEMACQLGYTTRYFHTRRLLESLTLAHGEGSYARVLSQLAKTDLVILDDFGLEAFSAAQRRDLLDVMEDRHGLRSTLVASQLPVNTWHEIIGEPTVADAILDRLIHNAHRITLKGESMRKRLADPMDNNT